MATIRVGIAGAAGFSGLELCRILARHPQVEITFITSEQFAGKELAYFLPELRRLPLRFEAMDPVRHGAMADAVLLALPADAAMRAAPDFLATGAVVIDLSAAFRLLDPQVYARWYKEEHVSAQLLPEAVYGLVEHERERIRTARLIANPGCYPTSALLPLLPFVKAGVLESGPVIVDSKSGVSGMGRKVAPESTFMEINENFRAYGVGTHRHTPEIAQELAKQAGNDVPLVFTPHLLPLTRGILSTIYIRTALDVGACNSLLADAYRDEPFVLAGDGVLPETAKVSGTNLCHCSAFPTNAPGTVVLISAIDNLVKGAAGQAVQNLNTRFGFPETAALV